jgi:regulator of protease activity HflC (stomatin/prohibitin superfamily)
VGTFFNFLKSTPGYIVCIFLPFMLLILYQGVKCVRLFRRYKKEQTAELDAEREQLREEREENARMLEQLQALKAELESQKAAAPAEEEESR